MKSYRSGIVKKENKYSKKLIRSPLFPNGFISRKNHKRKDENHESDSEKDNEKKKD